MSEGNLPLQSHPPKKFMFMVQAQFSSCCRGSMNCSECGAAAQVKQRLETENSQMLHTDVCVVQWRPTESRLMRCHIVTGHVHVLVCLKKKKKRKSMGAGILTRHINVKIKGCDIISPCPRAATYFTRYLSNCVVKARTT